MPIGSLNVVHRTDIVSHSLGGALGSGSVTGDAGENNCYPCNGAVVSGSVAGECGNFSISTIAIFARSF